MIEMTADSCRFCGGKKPTCCSWALDEWLAAHPEPKTEPLRPPDGPRCEFCAQPKLAPGKGFCCTMAGNEFVRSLYQVDEKPPEKLLNLNWRDEHFVKSASVQTSVQRPTVHKVDSTTEPEKLDKPQAKSPTLKENAIAELTATRKPRPQSENEWIEKLWRMGRTIQEIATEFDYSPRHVRRLVRGLGLPPRRPGRK